MKRPDVKLKFCPKSKMSRQLKRRLKRKLARETDGIIDSSSGDLSGIVKTEALRF